MKGKAKAKGKDKDKDKLQDTSMRAGAVYDYHDGSVHDIALRSYILQGYEEFKLTHGSFSSILSLLGQHALELQIERFFTVWAWKWDVEDNLDFGDHLGLFETFLPPFDEDIANVGELDAAGQPDGQVESGARADYLGKGAEVEFDAESLQEAISENVSIHDTQNSVVNSPIPPSAHLQGEPDDHEIGSNPESTLSLQVEGVAVEVGEDGAVTPEQAVTSPQNGQSEPSVETTTENDFGRTATPPMRERVPEFVSTSVFLANPETPTKTTRKKVFHTTIDRFTFAFIAGDDHGINLTSLGENVNDFVNELRACLAIADSKGDTEISLTPVTKILEPQDQYIISTGPYTSSLHSGFSSKSEHLFDCQAILHK
ncbi:hypothetical protein EW026_g1581 [Hermanssonia centrifuga]|uniref:Uncharacterized protein n=1 Tax=Hermanssonia centrifuga TaxID=98765 RepID=A0A4S4KR14_9APHY|nr:hypothetical protein EW026_g1581 [Hermanssonia centrifuga]